MEAQTGGLGAEMTGEENRAEVFMRAFDSLSKVEKGVVASRLLDDPELREEVLNLGYKPFCESECSCPRQESRAAGDANEA